MAKMCSRGTGYADLFRMIDCRTERSTSRRCISTTNAARNQVNEDLIREAAATRENR